MSGLKSNKPGLWTRFLRWLTLRFMPRHAQRVVFLTTLCMRLNQNKKDNRVFLSRINQIMHIVKDERALFWPMLMYDGVWHHPDDGITLETDHPLTFDELDNLARQAVLAVPNWSAYHRDPEVVLAETRQAFVTALMDQDQISPQTYQSLVQDLARHEPPSVDTNKLTLIH